MIIDESANAEQRGALEKVLLGEETEEAATHWWVFRAMSDTVHETLFKPIDFQVDLQQRTAKVEVPGVLESTGRPIHPPHSDEKHQARIVIPNGIEFEEAEMGSANIETGKESAIQLSLEDTYGQWNVLKHSGSGVVRA